MSTTSSALTALSLLPTVLAASTLDRAVDVHSKNSGSYSPMEQVADATREPARDDADTIMSTPPSSQTPNLSRSESAVSPNKQSSAQPSASQPTSAVAFPTSSVSQFTSNLIPPTPPTMSSTPAPDSQANNTTSTPKGSPRLTRPQLTSRLSSRQGGKRHASIGSQREMPFVLPSTATTSTGSTNVESPAPSLVSHTTSASVDQAQGWSRLLGFHIPGIGPSTPRSMSSGAASPKSPDEQRAASYFAFRRRGSVSPAVSPGKGLGKTRSAGATPPPPPPPPPAPPSPAPKTAASPAPMVVDEKKPPAPPRQHHSPISEEPSPTPSLSPRPRRANLSLDLGTTLAQRGSTASLPLIGHTPVETLVSHDGKPRRASMMMPPAAPPPHVHTPPVHPPAYEYPFLPHHAPRKPLEIRVEEIPPAAGGTMEGGSWVITVRLPGFHPDGITIGTRRGRVLVIVADNYNDGDEGAGHFERRISFGYDADMANIRAEFNGDMLKVTVPRRAMFGLTSIS
ncbi:heat shock protein HSP20 family protein [Ceratobasidium sp. AG-Ba]|nr:heat shock protein HSP20 family protein [Ceratobasidium sp. AG-Ba]